MQKVVIGDCVLYQGDCLEILPTIEAGSVDAVVTDPPYGVGLKGKTAKKRSGGQTFRKGEYQTTEDTPEYIERVCVPAIRFCIEHFPRTALTPGTRCMWKYPPPTDVGCFYSAAGTGVSRWGFCCSQPILYYGKCPYLANRMGSRPNSFGQTYPNDANEVNHPCAKPIRMWRPLVERASLPGMTVLDPFMGSGTTGVACIQTGRKFVGIEKDPHYFSVAVKRIEKACAELNDTLFQTA